VGELFFLVISFGIIDGHCGFAFHVFLRSYLAFVGQGGLHGVA
jgi:hypothetical protein